MAEGTHGSSQKGENGTSQDIPQSTYKFLLEQMESLRQENCSLKAGLKNNTSHITKLESEASRMRDMVLFLGTPGRSSTSVESDYISGTQSQPYLPANYQSDHSGAFMMQDMSSHSLQDHSFPVVQHGMKFSNNFNNPVDRRRRPEYLQGLPSTSHHSQQYDVMYPQPQALYPQELASPSPNSYQDVVQRLLVSMKNERASTMKSLNLEEQKKDFYLMRLEDLTSRLDSDKSSQTNEITNHQLEHDIALLHKTMELSLGSNAAMQERLDARLKHIQFLDMEIANLELYRRESALSTVDPGLHRAANQVYSGDMLCTRYNSFMLNGIIVSEASTQTQKLAVPASDFKTFEGSYCLCEVANRDSVSPLGTVKVTRTVQTLLTVTPSPGSSKPRQRQVESMESLSNRGTPYAWTEARPRDSVDSFLSDFDDTASMHSFTTSLPRSTQTPHVANKKEDLFAPLFAQSDKEELVRRFVKMGETIDGCQSMKQLGCTSFILQIMHDGSLLNAFPDRGPISSPGQGKVSLPGLLESVRNVRLTMSKVLWNIVKVTSDTKSEQEVQLFHTLEHLRRYCEDLFEFVANAVDFQDKNADISRSVSKKFNSADNPLDLSAPGEVANGYDFRRGLSVLFDPPIPSVTFVMKLSYDEHIKRVINEYGGLYAIAELFVLHYRCIVLSEAIGPKLGADSLNADDRTLQLLRRFVGFALINLTYGDVRNKTMLIQMPGFIDTIVAQMALDSEEMQQVMALFVRNLIWHTDEQCREILKKKNVAAIFTMCALKAKREDTLKSLLSALWNLSGHSSENRHSICSVKGALSFLATTLTSRVREIVESGGGILCNISNVVATNEDYRLILRERNCLQILLQQLKSGSLTIVSNACGTLWNLSARNAQDQKLLRDLGAVPMLKNLTHSKHTVIAQGSNAALRNLLGRRSSSANVENEKVDTAKSKVRLQRNSNFHDDATERDVSPRQHADAHQRILSPQAMAASQMHHLQDKNPSASPDLEGRGFQGVGLPEFGDNTRKTNLQANKFTPLRTGRSAPDTYPGNPVLRAGFSPIPNRSVRDFKTTEESPAANGQLSLRDCLKMIGERKSLQSPMKSAGANHAVPVGQSPLAMRNPDSSSHLSGNKERADAASNAYKGVPDVRTLLGQAGNAGKIPSALARKRPEDLLKSLCHVDDYYGNDDGPVNYSLQFRDEHMTPGIRSPRTEEIYETAMSECSDRTGRSIPPSARVQDPGMSDLGANGVENGRDRNFLRAGPAIYGGDRKIDRTAVLPEDDEKPTDFGAIFAEEQLFESVDQKSVMKPYAPGENFGHDTNDMSRDTAPEAYDISRENGENTLDVAEAREKDDKFDAGALTPGHSYHFRSGRGSGIMTPRTPMEYETPMMFSRSSSLDDVSSGESIHSSVTSGPTSRMMSGAVSPSHLPDSPSQSMPISPRRSPPPRVADDHPADADRRGAKPDLDEGSFKGGGKSGTARDSGAKIPPPDVKPPGYAASDQMNVYRSEDAMSEMTKFSALTIDDDVKIEPIDGKEVESMSPDEKFSQNDGFSRQPAENNDGDDKKGPELIQNQKQNHAPIIGYLTSLPSCDEIKNYVHEGVSSPMATLSEITCLKDDNAGFKKSTGSAFSVPISASHVKTEKAHSVISNGSRSSATGASAPPDSTTGKTEQTSSVTDQGEDPMDVAKTADAPDESDSDGSLTSSSDDDDDLLQEVINQAILKTATRAPPKHTGSSKHSGKSGKSRSRDKSEKSGARQPAAPVSDPPAKKTPVRAEIGPVLDKEKPNVKQRIESANVRLNGKTIVEYMDELIKSDDPDDGEPAQSNAAKTRRVIDDAETLSATYSVKRRMKENKRAEKIPEDNFAVTPSSDPPRIPAKHPAASQAVQSRLRVQSYLKEGVTSYATEGTPAEMSRCTSLSNITIESDNVDVTEILPAQLKESDSVPEKTDQPQKSGPDEPGGIKDESDVLEGLGRAEKMGVPNGPGYTTSMPQVDEIRKYVTEGSVCAGTEFSALTVDSETKIVPSVPAAGPSVMQKICPAPVVKPLLAGQNGQMSASAMSRADDSNRDRREDWPDNDCIHPSCHYNNENDNQGMKEERHNYRIEDTPLYLSGGSSLSSLEFGSDDDNDLLKECISSALPPEKKSAVQPPAIANAMHAYDPATNDCTRTYSHGAPDGRVDEDFTSGPAQGYYTGNGQFVNTTQVQLTRHYAQSYSTPPQAQYQQDTRALSADPVIGHQTLAVSKNDCVYPTSIGYTAVLDSLYPVSRQLPDRSFDAPVSSASLRDRNAAIAGRTDPDSESNGRTGNQQRARENECHPAYSDRRVRPDRKSNQHKRGNGASASRGRDSSSGSSTSYRRQQRHRHLSSNSRSTDVCNCRADRTGPPSRSRRKSANSASRNSSRPCDRNQHAMANRSRNSSRNAYRPGIVQLYPPLKDMNSVMEGVASVAARGDKVVADMPRQRSGASVRSSGSSLARSATFVNDSPSEILLETMSRAEREQYAAGSSVSSVSRVSSGRPGQASSRASVASSRPDSKSKDVEKAGRQTKSKPKKMWKGIKKLLSPSDDKGGKSKEDDPKVRGTRKSPVKSQDNIHTMSPQKNAVAWNRPVVSDANKSSSDLSLASSDGSDHESDNEIPVNQKQSDIAPYGLLPKSPAVRRSRAVNPPGHTQAVVERPPPSVGRSVWRRTPPTVSGRPPVFDEAREGVCDAFEQLDLSDEEFVADRPKIGEKLAQGTSADSGPHASGQLKAGAAGSSFASPTRTLSPRVQQVPPFNYRPPQRQIVGEEAGRPKSTSDNVDCDQAPV